MNRRDFLKSAAAAAVAPLLPVTAAPARAVKYMTIWEPVGVATPDEILASAARMAMTYIYYNHNWRQNHPSTPSPHPTSAASAPESRP